MRILGVDPALQKCGWGVIEAEGNRHHFVASGLITPPTKAPLAERLVHLHDALRDVMTQQQPNACALEETFVNVNGQSTLKLGQARGVILLTLAQSGAPVHEYAPKLIKKTVTGKGGADKNQMIQMIGFLLPGCNVTQPDEADALAIAICHAHHAPLHKALQA